MILFVVDVAQRRCSCAALRAGEDLTWQRSGRSIQVLVVAHPSARGMFLKPVGTAGQNRNSADLALEALIIRVHPALAIKSRFDFTAVDLDAHRFAGGCVFRDARAAAPRRDY